MISIIVPVYNSSLFLDKCIRSVVTQTYRDIELLLVNDGSTDNSGEICESWIRKDRRIRVIHQSNAGVSAARNRGIIEAKGEYIMFLDSDDAIQENTCFQLIRYQRKNNVDCIIFGALQKSGTLWISRDEKKYNSIVEFKQDFEKHLHTELLCPVWNKFYKRELIQHFFPQEMSFGEDLVFCLRYLTQCETICFVPWPLYIHNNQNEGSITHTFRVGHIEDIERWQDAIIFFSEKYPIPYSLYNKYIKDVLFWLKRFYASTKMDGQTKKMFLKRWYTRSHLKGLNFSIYSMSLVDRLVLQCLHWHLWNVPNNLLSIKYALKRRKR